MVEKGVRDSVKRRMVCLPCLKRRVQVVGLAVAFLVSHYHTIQEDELTMFAIGCRVDIASGGVAQ